VVEGFGFDLNVPFFPMDGGSSVFSLFGGKTGQFDQGKIAF
jgi:hypothetical protein